jgi:hypothetical protein
VLRSRRGELHSCCAFARLRLPLWPDRRSPCASKKRKIA